MSALNYFGSWASIIGGTIGLFGVAEVVATDDIKGRIRSWLTNTQTNTTDKWPTQFADLFDSIFGKRHLSWRCFGLSCVASIVAVLICTILIWIIESDTYSILASKNILTAFIACIVLNTLPDYLSLLESRFMLKVLIQRKSKALSTCVILMVDILATVAIWFILVFVILCLYDQYWGLIAWPETISQTYRILITMWGADNLYPNSIKITFCSTFFTSVWLWLYLIGGGVIKLWSSFNKGRITLFSKLNTANYPVTSIGFVVSLVITLGFMIVAPFALK